MCYVYVLYSPGFRRYYVGITENVQERIKDHNRGSTKSTKAFIPWKLVHSEEYSTMMEARKREKYLKSAAGRRWRKNRFETNKGD